MKILFRVHRMKFLENPYVSIRWQRFFTIFEIRNDLVRGNAIVIIQISWLIHDTTPLRAIL